MADGIDYTWQQATNLAGKRVLLTGCASGIGRATAQLYCAGRCDRCMAATSMSRRARPPSTEIRAAGGKAEFVRTGPDAARTRSMRSSTPCATRRAARSTSSRASRASTSSSRFSRTSRFDWNVIINVNYVGAGAHDPSIAAFDDRGRQRRQDRHGRERRRPRRQQRRDVLCGQQGRDHRVHQVAGARDGAVRHQLQLRGAGPDGNAVVPRHDRAETRGRARQCDPVQATRAAERNRATRSCILSTPARGLHHRPGASASAAA